MQRRKNLTCGLLLFGTLLSVAVCDDLFGMKITTEESRPKETMQYRFHYFVKDDTTGDYKSQEETKEGDSVRGSYTLAEPNGDLRTVTYKASPGKGFEAKVDVHPMKPSTEGTTQKIPLTDPIKETTLESNVKLFTGGFLMDILKKPQQDMKTEMGIRFSTRPSPVTEPVPNSEDNATEKQIYDSLVSNQTEMLNSTEEDPIEKEIDEVENSMPKLPEFVLSDNKTHFKFHKDPEEALLDERITQIARQLAETNLRREYEERKLGHILPISLTSIDPSAPSYLSKSIKFPKKDHPNFRPQPNPIHILTQLKLLPQYVPRTRFPPVTDRQPLVQTSAQTQKTEQPTYETITNVPEILKINKTENQVKQIDKLLRVKGTEYNTAESVTLTPMHVPTFLQFFSPYVMATQGNYVTQAKPEPQQYVTPVKNHTDVSLGDNATVYGHITIIKHQNATKF